MMHVLSLPVTLAVAAIPFGMTAATLVAVALKVWSYK